MELRALFFDIDDTLYSSTRFAGLARERAVEAMIARGLQATKSEVLEELAQVVAEFGSNDPNHYDRLLTRLPASAVQGLNSALLVTAGVIAYHETKWKELRAKPAAHGLLEDLSRTDLKLGIISAGLTSKQMEKVLRLGIDRFLDSSLIFITDQVGIAKSNAELYRLACSTAGVEPGASLHVGDHPLHDMDSAKKAGMITALHAGSGKYAPLKSVTEPDYRVADLGELRALLASEFSIPV